MKLGHSNSCMFTVAAWTCLLTTVIIRIYTHLYTCIVYAGILFAFYIYCIGLLWFRGLAKASTHSGLLLKQLLWIVSIQYFKKQCCAVSLLNTPDMNNSFNNCNFLVYLWITDFIWLIYISSFVVSSMWISSVCEWGTVCWNMSYNTLWKSWDPSLWTLWVNHAEMNLFIVISTNRK